MNSAPNVSVIMPAYNDEQFIADAISSVFAQTYTSWEIIVVDDGSSDKTAEIANSFGSRVVVFQITNSGSAVARNFGISRAKAPYIAFLDADDYWLPHKLQVQMQYLSLHQECNFVYCCWQEWPWPEVADIKHLPKNKNLITSEELDIDQKLSGMIVKELLLDCIVHTSTVVFKRKLLDRVGMFDVRLRRGQDYDLWLRCAEITEIRKLKAVCSLYRVRSGSITKRMHSENYGGILVEAAFNRFKSSDRPQDVFFTLKMKKRLCTLWRNFALEQLHYKQYASTRCSILRALRWWPFDSGAWRCLAKLYVLYLFDLISRLKTHYK